MRFSFYRIILVGNTITCVLNRLPVTEGSEAMPALKSQCPRANVLKRIAGLY